MRNNGVTIMMFGQLLVTQEPTEDDYKLVLTVKQRGEEFRGKPVQPN